MGIRKSALLYSCAIGLAAGATLLGAEDNEDALLARAQQTFKPLPADAGTPERPLTPERVALGRSLFFETRVSSDGKGSCGGCHNPYFYGTDALPGYRAMFEKAFPDETEPVTAQNWGKAIGAFERTLITPAAFDRYLKGDKAALDAQAKQGLDKFMSYGCSGCHNGVTIGGQMFQKFGLTQDYWLLTGSQEIDIFKGRDKGKFQDTRNDTDAFIFKVQQLRNVAVTPPYFHDGSVAELGDAIRIMGKLQLGRDLADGDIADVKAFLQSLTGEVPAQFAAVPSLPAAAYKY